MNTPDRLTFLEQMHALLVNNADPFVRAYPSFLNFFQNRNQITSDDFVLIANAAYGWMPRMLKIRGTNEDWGRAAQILTRAKQCRITESCDLEILARLVNNSLVGPSKLLHFANPKRHAIWDSRVYRYLTNRRPDHSRLLKRANYLRYLEICDEIAQWLGIHEAAQAVSENLGYPVTPFRAIELTMWANGAQQ